MPMYANAIITRNDEHEKIEPIMVTITLEEYRSLIEYYTRVQCPIKKYQKQNVKNANIVN